MTASDRTSRHKQLLQEFREFALRGNVVDIAVGLTVGAAFSAIVKSFVNDVLMPPLGLILGGANFGDLYWVLKGRASVTPGMPLAEAQKAGAVTLNYGLFINNLLHFLIVALAFFLLIKGINTLKRRQKAAEPAPPPAPTTKTCPYCQSAIPLAATRCPQCTSHLSEGQATN